MNVLDRIKAVIEHSGLSEAAFARSIDLSQSTLNSCIHRGNDDNGWKLLPRIWQQFPDISREWLFFDEGEMLRGPVRLIPEAAPMGGNIHELLPALGGEEAAASAGGITVMQLRAIVAGEELPSAVTLARWLATAKLSANFVLANVGPALLDDLERGESVPGQGYVREIRLQDLREAVARDLGLETEEDRTVLREALQEISRLSAENRELRQKMEAARGGPETFMAVLNVPL